MKNTLFVLFTFIAMHLVTAQSTTVWYDDLEEASSVAYKSNKPIMLFFTGSDWCGWCIRLQKEVFQQEAFKQWASKNVVLVELDFPSKKVLPTKIKEQNQMLQRQFAVQGYPTCWFVSVVKNGDKFTLNRLGQTGYMAGGPEPWITNAKTFLK
ncbi:MAG: thioredoxin family protein [Flavobacteriales bacterium]|jgi:protein disulfide-isomerase